MNEIEVPRKINTKVLEELHQKMEFNSKETNLVIPAEIEYRGFGILPGLFLVVFTWMREKEGSLVIPIEEDDTNELKKFASDFYGYLILMTIWRHKDVLNHKGKSLKLGLRDYLVTTHNNIDILSDSLSNESVLLPCFDHYSKKRGLSQWFYTSEYKFVNTPSDLEYPLYLIFESISKIYRTRIRKNASDSFETLQQILWELLKNTHDHAIKDYLGQAKLLPNTRGFFMRIHRSSKKNFIVNAKNKGLELFYDSALPESNNVFVLEVSVFDSGPGLVKNFLGKNWNGEQSLIEDINTIRKCLIKGQTSAKNSNADSKGLGLDLVLQLLNKKKGFLKIRTGRISVYRDLVNASYKPTNNPEEVELYDWNTCDNKSYSEMSECEGTLITLAYPLGA